MPATHQSLVAGDQYDPDKGELVILPSKRTKIMSGIEAKPSDNVNSAKVWPHYSLQLSYAVAPIRFDEITFEQLVAGEIHTIINCSDNVEVRGHLNLLFHITYLKIKRYIWSALRSFYAVVVRSIEQHENTWASDFKCIEEFTIDPCDRIRMQPDKPRGHAADKHWEEWFCWKFNLAKGCHLDAPHDSMVGCPPAQTG